MSKVFTKEINVCAGCPNNCCIGVGRLLANQEELNRLDKFSGLKIEKEGPFYRVSVRHEGDPCPYFLNYHCTIHDQRPFDCRLYPVIIDEIREINGKIRALYTFHRGCPQVKYFKSIWTPDDLEEMRAWLKRAYPEREIKLI